ncbi:MAG: HAMP domain-containing sensor histidine kinase, partial [Verrucomicrobiota bacterium]
MNRSILRWILFGSCLLLLIGALSLITARSLSLERERTTANEEARLREQVRLALWRMEAEASSVVVRESSRPTKHYQTFPEVGLLVDGKGANLTTLEIREPSPLLGTTPDLVKLHFQCQLSPQQGANAMCSPQIPLGRDRDLALEQFEVAPEIAEAERRMVKMKQLLVDHRGWEDIAGFGFRNLGGKTGTAFVRRDDGTKATVAAANTWGTADQTWMDANLIRKPIEQTLNAARTPAKKPVGPSSTDPSATSLPSPEEEIGDMKTIWLGDELMLLRQIKGEGNLRMQGAWLDWPDLEKRLLASIADLLPEARVLPIKKDELRDDWRALVALPVRLEPGPLPAAMSATATPSGMRTALALAWICLLSTSVAIGFVLHRTIQLSERRAAFVSAVTHELRTPLTTFRLYSEMLAEGAVSEEEKRKNYLRTLCAESDRLTRLVDNVLAFSRIERTRSLPETEQIALEDLIKHLRPRLEERCQQVSLDLKMSLPDSAADSSLQTDAMVMEQILFNLVDNAAKYAAPDSEPREIHLDIDRVRNVWQFTVRDFGPGLSPTAIPKLFQPFCKSA